MEYKKYEKDIINGEWHEVKQEPFTEEEWKQFCDRWSNTEKQTNKLEIFAIIVLMILAILIHF